MRDLFCFFFFVSFHGRTKKKKKVRAGAAGDIVRLNSAVKKMVTAACQWSEAEYFTHAVRREEISDYYDHVTSPIDLKVEKR